MFSMAALGWILYSTRGHYRGPYVWYFLIVIAALFVRVPREREDFSWRALAAIFAITTAASPLLIYSENPSWVWVIRASFALFALSLVRPGPHLLALAGLGLSAVIPASPRPFIDVWTHSMEVADALLSGVSPYSITLTQLYRDQFSTPTYAYPPIVILWIAPWKALTGDVRYAWVFTHVLTGFLLQRASRSWVVAAAFLAFPAVPFIIEQSWIDGLSMLWGVSLLLAYQKQNRAAFGIFAGLLLATKQTNLLFLPVLIKLYPSSWPYAVATVAATLGPFIAWDPQGFVKGVLWPLLPNAMTGNSPLTLAPRRDALSLVAELSRRNIFLPGWAPWMVAGGILAWAVSRGRSAKQLFVASSLAYFSFFWLSAWAFCNYYWFASLGVWLSVAKQDHTNKSS